MAKPRVLHIAPQNFAGMPMDFTLMQRRAGYESRLVTIFQNTLNFEEDIALGIKLPSGSLASKWRNSKMEWTGSASRDLKYIKPKNTAENVYFIFRDLMNKFKIEDIIKKYDLDKFDIYHFDGGMDFYRDSRFAIEMKKRGKKIVCCYYGSDLRTRGIFKELDDISDLNLTVEFDHIDLYKGINYLFFPFDVKKYEIKERNNPLIKIIHSPTNRKFKGTDKILPIIAEIEKERRIEFMLIENMDRNALLELKQTCDLAIDQVGGEMGGSGYGKNSIENLSMGIPTFTEFSEDYLEFIPENPFIHSTIDTLKQNLLSLIDNAQLRKDKITEGRNWVEKYHSFEAVNEKLEELYRKHNIADV